MQVCIDVHASQDDLPFHIASMLREVVEDIRRIEGKMSAVSDKLDGLDQKVAALTTVTQSAATLIEGLAAQAANGASPETLARIDSAGGAVGSATTALATVVAANQPQG